MLISTSNVVKNLKKVVKNGGNSEEIMTTNLPCITNKEYEITLFLMFNREFMNYVYRTFRIISRGL